MVPLKYNIRSIRARKIGSLMTILGVGMVVWACVFAFGLSEGLDRTLKIAADPLDVIVLRKGSTSEAVSAVTEAAARDIKALPGIATDSEGRPLAASELVVFAYLPRKGSPRGVWCAWVVYSWPAPSIAIAPERRGLRTGAARSGPARARRAGHCSTIPR